MGAVQNTMNKQFEDTNIFDELKSYLEQFCRYLASLPSYYPARLDADLLHQPVYVQDYTHHPRSTSDEQRLQVQETHQAIGYFVLDDFLTQWLVQVPPWSSEVVLLGGKEYFVHPRAWNALAPRRKSIILGHAGSGKSWFLKSEGRRVAREQLHLLQSDYKSLDDFVLPIYLPVRSFSWVLEREGIALQNAITRILQQRYGLSEHFCQWMRYWLINHPSLLLLDGLEDLTPEQQRLFNAALQQFTNPRCRWLLASRMVGYRGTPFRWVDKQQRHEYELTLFHERQVERYINAWYASDEQRAWELREAIRREPFLRTLASVPQLLSWLCLLHERSGRLPSRRVPFYEAVLQLVVPALSDSKRNSDADNQDTQTLAKILETLAWRCTSQEHPWLEEFQEDTLRQHLTAILLDMGAVQEEPGILSLLTGAGGQDGLLVRTELFVEQQERACSYRFLYRPLQHYLVARYLAQQEPEQCVKLVPPDLWIDSDWQEVMALLAGCLPNATRLFYALLHEANHHLDRSLLMGRCLVEADKTLLEPTIVEFVIKQTNSLLTIPSSYQLARLSAQTMTVNTAYQTTTQQVYLILLHLHGTQIAETLLAALRRSENKVTMQCALVWALGQIGDKRAINEVLMLLRQQDDEQYNTGADTIPLRCSAIWTLGRLRAVEALDKLIQIACSASQDERVRCAAIWALGQICDERAVDALLPLLNERELLLRVAVVWALGNIGNRRCIEALLEAVDAEEQEVHDLAIDGLEKIGVSALPHLLEVVAAQRNMGGVDYSLLCLLGQLGGTKAINLLVESLEDQDVDMRKLALQELGEIGDKGVGDFLLERLKDQEEELEVRIEAAKALAKLEVNDFLPGYLHCLREQLVAKGGEEVEANNRIEVQRFLTSLGEIVIHPLLEILRINDEMLCEYAGVVLGAIGNSSVVEDLLGMLYAPDKPARVREAIIAALGEIGDPKAVGGLQRVLFDEQELVRAKAVLALGKIKGIAVADDLVAKLYDRSETVRWFAAQALVQRADAGAKGAIITYLHREIEDAGTYAKVIQALGKIGSDAEVGLLEKIALKDGVKNIVFYQAARALASIHTERAMRALLNISQVESAIKRKEAVTLLGQFQHAQALDGLIVALQDQDSNVCRAAAAALGQRGDPQAIPGLARAAQDSRPEVMWAAIDALGSIDHAQARKELQKALYSERREVRKAAAIMLGRLGDSQATEELLGVMRDDYERWLPDIRTRAIRMLWQLGDPRAMWDLFTALWDEDGELCSVSAVALAEIGIPLVIRLLHER